MVSVCLEEQIRLTCLQSDDVRIILRPGKKKRLLSLKCFRVDIAHLSLYNLSVIHKKKYFDSEMYLMSYINDNWELLQLGEVNTQLTAHYHGTS